jgi:hypothetical protein
VEIDGVTKSEYSVFVKALTASLQLKQEFPHSSIKLRDADEKAPVPCLLTSRVAAFDQATSRIQLPYSKTAAYRAVRTTIGHELKARCEIPRDLPYEMKALLMHLSRADSSS